MWSVSNLTKFWNNCLNQNSHVSMVYAFAMCGWLTWRGEEKRTNLVKMSGERQIEQFYSNSISATEWFLKSFNCKPILFHFSGFPLAVTFFSRILFKYFCVYPNSFWPQISFARVLLCDIFATQSKTSNFFSFCRRHRCQSSVSRSLCCSPFIFVSYSVFSVTMNCVVLHFGSCHTLSTFVSFLFFSIFCVNFTVFFLLCLFYILK